MSEKDKTCGTCLYGNYYKRHHNMKMTSFVDCEVYSTKKASKEKGCSNWKEKKSK